MKTQREYIPINPDNRTHIDAIVEIWNSSCESSLMISPRLVEFNLRPSTDGATFGQLVFAEARAVGFVVGSAIRNGQVAPPSVGWVDAIAVTPSSQRQGLGSSLLQWAEMQLRQHGCTTFTVGASLRPFVPGLPTTLYTQGFFQFHGYHSERTVWDVAANLALYQSPETVRPIDGLVRPAQPGEEADLLHFLAREFPGRWHFACQEMLHEPQTRFSDYMVLWTERGIDGFCQLTFEDSHRPIERYYPYPLPRRWGQLGPIGVSADRRGRGYGAALLDAGLRRLHNNGVNGCIIDWTTHLALYGKFGFEPYREYQQFLKQVNQ
ncbi:MAG: GNAT family N-acetyltransferase [Caldilineaceae bacterium]